ncbi:hypothetical protein Agabi119p4_8419 [Agaricus bisporus var. burnettii]|uniref:Uncharacterized protein n=1 Tax=Agaricus bisporus var. burnettii TaxID=192524 RepID=A0A8H7C721_AGABI|nr:hypothetical protein Agabi119p4_8419 [Agaricus bisporus var. burnettii]
MGIRSVITTSYTPPNHKSATDHPNIIIGYINTELSHGRYTGPFSKSRLESLIGPFRSSPLGTVPKSGPDQFRIIQDLSFPRNDPHHQSVNSEIDSLLFPCDWGTFTQIAEIVRNSPPGTQAATMDVDAAFRCCPIKPEQQPHFVIQWDDFFYIDHNAPFGAVSSGGVFGRLADTMATIIRHHTSDECRNWVDDFVLFRSPTTVSVTPTVPYVYPYDLPLIQNIANKLGWPWKPSKTRPFASVFRYLGFMWDLEEKSVYIPDEKRLKYLERIDVWYANSTHTRKEAESLLGTLVHCSLAIADGRSRLPALSRFVYSFEGKSFFSRRTPSASTMQDVAWWYATLKMPSPGSSIKPPPPPVDINLWVDASTSYGIGVVFDDSWEAWRLVSGWDRHPQRRIGWAEAIALECGIRWAIHRGMKNSHFIIKSDNMGVIGALEGGKSRNVEQNIVLQRITTLLRIHSLWISTSYTPSASNLADAPSRGVAPPGLLRSVDTFTLPAPLSSFLHSRAT